EEPRSGPSTEGSDGRRAGADGAAARVVAVALAAVAIAAVRPAAGAPPRLTAEAEHTRQRERADKRDHGEARVACRHAHRGCRADRQQCPGGAEWPVHPCPPGWVGSFTTHD